jgi:glycosyltransferase involved in cell wall biosynthesis
VRDGADTVGAAVSSALGQDYRGDIEVIAAEGGSTDASRAVLDALAARHPQVVVVDNPTGTTPAGLNAAIRAGTGEVVVRCDAHSELAPGYVSTAVARLDATGAAVVGGIQDAVGETFFERAVAIAMSNRLGSGGAAYRSAGHPGPVETVYLGVFRRSVLAEVGLYDESLLRNQDYELNHRIIEAGYVVFFDPELRVRYRPRGTLPSLWRQYFDYGRWKRLVLRRYPASLQPRQLAAPVLVAGLVGSAAASAIGLRRLSQVVPVAYGAAVAIATGVELAGRRDPAAVGTLVVLPTMHVAWGTGFWRAGIDDAGPQPGSLMAG